MNVFGRLEIEDVRDKNYPLSAVLPAAIPGINYRYWNDLQWWGDQGRNPWCVAYAWLHWAEDGPVTHKEIAPPLYTPLSVYSRAQQLDQWPGENYDGTSVRAGAKVLKENGIISEYRWAWDAQTVAHALLTAGPVVLGTRWFEGMSRPTSDGFLKPTGAKVGGHAYVLNGVNMEKRFFRMKNSWGRDWGINGRAKIDFDDLQFLLDNGGEACMATETN